MRLAFIMILFLVDRIMMSKTKNGGLPISHILINLEWVFYLKD